MSLLARHKPPGTEPTSGKPGVTKTRAAGETVVTSLQAATAPAKSGATASRRSLLLRRIGRIFPRPVRIAFRGLFALAILGMLAMGVLHLMVLRGPISIGFLVGPLEEAINRELHAGKVTIENAVIRQSEDGRGIEFRLANLRILDNGGAILAETPFAGISLSGAAILRGRLAPVSVEFIRPVLRLTTTADGNLALAVTASPATAAGAKSGAIPGAAAPRPNAANPAPDGRASPATAPIDVIATIQTAISDFRHGDAASSYLRELGVRDATLSIEHGGHLAIWHVPGFSIDVQHFQKRSVIAGEGLIGSEAGQWGLSFRTTESNKGRRLRLETEIAELVPSSIAANLSFLPALSALEMPVAGTAKLDTVPGEGLSAAEVKLSLSPGRLLLPPALGGPVQVTGGSLHLTYSAADRKIIVHPSDISWNQSRAVWTGMIQPGDASHPWRFDLSSRAASVNGVVLDNIEVAGSIVPDTRVTRLDRVLVEAKGTQLAMSGGTVFTDKGSSFQLAGSVGATTLPVVLDLWPKTFATNTATWLRENVRSARTSGGTIRLAPPPISHAASAPPTGMSAREADMLAGIALDLELTDVQFMAVDGAAPAALDAAHLKIDSDRLELSAPQLRLLLPSGRHLPVKDPRLVMFPLSSPDTAAEITLQASAPASIFMELIDQEPFGLMRRAGLDTSAADGRSEATLKVGFISRPGLKLADLKLDGRLRIADARAKGIFGGLDMANGNLLLGLTEKAIDAKGEMLVSGVPVKMSWQRIFEVEPDKQPPVRLTASLDAADRDALGLAVNHMIIGEVPVVVTVEPEAQGQPKVHVEANLGAAELVLENMAWRKAPGRPALLHTDVARTKDGRTELTGFKIVGDDISLDGAITLDGKNQLKSFNFPDFAVNVLTKLEMSGRVREDGVLDVKTKGTNYDGRPFFKALFAAGQVTERPVAAPKNRPGLDLAVEIDTLIGFNDTNLRNVHFHLKRRGDKITTMQATGALSESNVPVNAEIRTQAGQRLLLANSTDAGSALRLVGFYPNMRGGNGSLEVNLDGRGLAEKTGRLRTRQFAILGDAIVSEVLQAPETGGKGARRIVREQIEFDRLDFPFSVGHGQVVLGDSTINGPLLGARLNGKIDYNKQIVFVEGTYVPLYGLNSIPNNIPIIGDILSGGRSGEGLFGITFQIQGPMGRPAVQVNPLSMLTPGLLRQIWETAPQGQVVEPRPEPKPLSPALSSSAPPQSSDKSSRSGSASSSPPQRTEPSQKGTQAEYPGPRPQREPGATSPKRLDGN